jgi:hypothetical protein
MSLEISKDPSGTCPLHGLGGRNARERRHDGRLQPRHQNGGAIGGAGDFCENARTAHAIRRAQDFHASLEDSLAFLQTQDEALERLQRLLEKEAADRAALGAEFEAVAGESFNGLHLFGCEGDEGLVYMNSPESGDCVNLNRPRFGTGPLGASGLENLRGEVASAREENHKEQRALAEILLATPDCAMGAELSHGHLENTESAGQTAFRTRESVLRDSRLALGAQANAAHSAVLRLFQ